MDTKIRGYAKIIQINTKQQIYYLKIRNRKDIVVGYCHLKHCSSLVGIANLKSVPHVKLDNALFFKVLNLISNPKLENVRNENYYSLMKKTPLQWAFDQSHWGWFLFFYYILGANIKAKSSKQKYLEFILTKSGESKLKRFCFYAILKDLDSFVESDEEKESLLKLLLQYGNKTLPGVNFINVRSMSSFCTRRSQKCNND